MKYFKLTILFAALAFFAACNKDDDSLSPEEQFQVDIEIIDQYLAENNLTAQTTASGLRYIIEEEGTGANPVVGELVIFQFDGYFTDNTPWASSNGPEVFDLSVILDGLIEGIPLLKIGGKGKFLLPSVLAFGPDGASTVPPNAVMIFDVELPELCLSDSTFATKQRCLDLFKINEYLTENNLVADSVTSSGIHYIIDVEGTGGSPSSSSTVEVLYKGYLLDGFVFDQTNGTTTRSFPLNNVIEGWKQGLKLFKKGGKGTILVPSSLGYGSSPPANSNIPFNAVLAFDIELVDF